jgi:steroid delta-isomerase-like uncharacterized protein
MEAATSTGPRIDPQFLEEWDARYLAAWNSHDAHAVALACTDDVVWDDPSLAEPCRGHDGVRAFVEATVRAFPDFHVDETEPALISAVAPVALSRYRMTGTMLGPWEPGNFAATGARIAVFGVDEWTFRDGLMCHYTTRYDTLGMARQLGIMPPSGSGAERAMARLQHVQARFQRRKAKR